MYREQPDRLVRLAPVPGSSRRRSNLLLSASLLKEVFCYTSSLLAPVKYPQKFISKHKNCLSFSAQLFFLTQNFLVQKIRADFAVVFHIQLSEFRHLCTKSKQKTRFIRETM